MSATSSNDLLKSLDPPRYITDGDVVEAAAVAGKRGELAVFEQFANHLYHGMVTPKGIFQLCILIEESDMDEQRGLFHAAIFMRGAYIALGADPKAWSELTARPGRLRSILHELRQPGRDIVREDAERPTAFDHRIPKADHAPMYDVVDVLLTRLTPSQQTLQYMHDLFHEGPTKRMIKNLLLLREKDLVPGSA